MEPFIRDYLQRLAALHRQAGEAVAALPEEALGWSPRDDINSVSVLVAHLTGAERYWIGDVVCGEPSHRNRDAEFRTVALSAQELLSRLDASLDYVRRALHRVSLDMLAETRVSPRDSQQVSVAWAILHALEHTAQHVGHVGMTQQMWERSLPR